MLVSVGGSGGGGRLEQVVVGGRLGVLVREGHLRSLQLLADVLGDL